MSDDGHRINRDRRDEDDSGEEHECPECGRVFETAGRLREHRERERRETFRGSAIGDAILERKRHLEGRF